MNSVNNIPSQILLLLILKPLDKQYAKRNPTRWQQQVKKEVRLSLLSFQLVLIMFKVFDKYFLEELIFVSSIFMIFKVHNWLHNLFEVNF